MPKEITHWLVALKMAEVLRTGPPDGAGPSECPNALQLGAVFPDVLYYLTHSPNASPYREIARACHGARGEDTHTLIRQLAALLPGSPYPEALRSFLAGVACHIETDRTFHPLVYYLTGNDDDADPRRRTQSVKDHRRLECLMDIYFCGEAKGSGVPSLRSILRELELPLPYLLETFCRASASVHVFPATVAVTKQALENFRLLQGLFRKRPLARFLAAIAPCLPETAQEVTALFYSPLLDAQLPRAARTLAYRNPVSGVAEEASLCNLFDRAVTRSVALHDKIEAAVSSGAPVLPEKGASLSYGVSGDDTARPRYFAERPFFHPET